MRPRTSSFFAPLLVIALLAGCSSDGGDDGEQSTDTTRRTTTTTSATDDNGGTTPETTVASGSNTGGSTVSTIKNPRPQPEPNRARYCGEWGRLVSSNDAAYDDDDPAQLKNHYNAVLAVARELEAAAPLDIKGAVQVAIREAQRVVDTGSRDQFRSDESRVNGQRLQDYAAEHC